MKRKLLAVLLSCSVVLVQMPVPKVKQKQQSLLTGKSVCLTVRWR